MSNRRNSAPMYLQLARQLQDRIDSGSLPPSSRLPSEPELSAEFGVNRLTVRQAVAELDRAGSVEIRRGIGTFVRKPVVRAVIRVDPDSAQVRIGSLPVPLAIQGMRRAEELVVESAIAPDGLLDQRVAGQLEHAAADLSRFETLVWLEDQPWCVNSYWLPTGRLPAGFGPVGEPIDMAAAITEAFGFELESDWRAFSAVAADIADAERLDLATGSPLLVREGVNCTPDGETVMYVRRRIKGENASFVLDYRGRFDPARKI
ncbi:GntR family transcriptional regulator [Catenulispora sp. NF23]|uniref:GntR family transcriptional regulator n=1 Tax=Catenulispora pinistramenti TaxID=2705254 RepID=A0ABS5KZS1_9ACTN|nr:GntR family transcriptional regulator [Catenulispora pinistramenti]MBS2535598.1 GntR family transcriptional regulator [Catenulispora pinistramenti]MBS2551570.1 GntR family transcriptional regulator [Catenulispora pinistramenti]